jgi:hypothetical protein
LNDPVPAAVAVVVRGTRVQVLGTDGGWRTVPVDTATPRPELSPDGTRLTVASDHPEAGVTVVELRTGQSRTVPAPAGYRPDDGTAWTFVDEQTLLLQNHQHAWFVDANTGAAHRARDELHSGQWTAVGADGTVLVSADWQEPNVLTQYRGQSVTTVSMNHTGRLTSVQVDGVLAAGTTYDDRPFSLVVADQATLTPIAWQPVIDHEGNYSPGLHALTVTDQGLVLFRFATVGAGTADIRVMAWDPDTGQLYRVSQTRGLLDIGFAADLLRTPQ